MAPANEIPSLFFISPGGRYLSAAVDRDVCGVFFIAMVADTTSSSARSSAQRAHAPGNVPEGQETDATKYKTIARVVAAPSRASGGPLEVESTTLFTPERV